MAYPTVNRLRLLALSRFAIVFLSFLCGAEISSAHTHQSQEASAEQLLQEGLQAYQGHDLTQAVARLKQAYQLAPENPELPLILGLMLYEQEPASPEAQRLMELAVPRFPANLELRLKLLDSYLQTRNESKLPSLLSGLEGLMADNTRFAFDVVYALVRYAHLKTATMLLDGISTRLQPRLRGRTDQDLRLPSNQSLMHDAGEVQFIEAIIAASRDNKNEALRLFQAADRYDFPARDSLQMRMLAEALFRLQEYQLSIQAYGVYLGHFPLDAAARMHLALGYFSCGLMAKAGQNFKTVSEQAPRTPDVHLYLGMALLEQKSNVEARREFQQELIVDQQSYQAMAELAYLDYLDGDNEHCHAWLEKARPLNTDWTETNMVSGLLANRLGQFDRAIQFLKHVIEQRPNDYKAHFQLSLAYRRMGNAAKAEEHADIYDRLMTEEKARQLGDKAPKH